MSRRDQRASQNRSKRLQQASIGTHVVDNSRRTTRSNVNLGSHRVATRVKRGQINQVMPDTATRESVTSYAARTRRRGFVVQDARRMQRRNILLLLAIIVAAVAIALGVARFTYTSGISSKMALNDASASAALVAPSNSADPYYVLVAGEYTESGRTYDGPHLLTLVRIDPVSKTLTLLSIPSNIELTLSDGKYHTLAAAQTVGGDAELITKVSNLTGVSIAHYVKTDDEGFVKLVDALGGVTVTLPEEVDDPEAGSLYIPAGTQTLDGASALVACRADNYAESIAVRAKNQTAILAALGQKTLGRSGLDAASTLDTVASCIKTDMSYDQVTSLVSALGDGQDLTVYQTRVPGSKSVETDGTYFSVSTSSLSSLMTAIGAGSDPNVKSETSSVNASQVTVAVKNGAGVTGGASEVANVLKGYGFQVASTGNTDSYVYDETLVVYADTAKKAAAEAIVDDLGIGRTVEAGYYYTLDTDVMVIIGKDWKPLS